MSHSDPLIVFFHIPKTAGSSLERILGREYGEGIFILKEWRPGKDRTGVFETEESLVQYRALPPEEKDSYKVIKGHFHFGFAPMLPADATYFTLLRDPVERVISTYYFTLRNPANYLHAAVAGSGMTLREFVESDLTPEITNDQTRRLAGVTDADPEKGNFTSGAEMLAAAKRHIEKHFSVVGLCERFDETVLLLRRVFGWKTPYYRRINVGTNRPESTDPGTIAIIRERNALDLELYQWAQERFARQIAELGEPFQKELRSFHRWNPLFSRYLKLRRCWQEFARSAGGKS